MVYTPELPPNEDLVRSQLNLMSLATSLVTDYGRQGRLTIETGKFANVTLAVLRQDIDGCPTRFRFTGLCDQLCSDLSDDNLSNLPEARRARKQAEQETQKSVLDAMQKAVAGKLTKNPPCPYRDPIAFLIGVKRD